MMMLFAWKIKPLIDDWCGFICIGHCWPCNCHCGHYQPLSNGNGCNMDKAGSWTITYHCPSLGLFSCKLGAFRCDCYNWMYSCTKMEMFLFASQNESGLKWWLQPWQGGSSCIRVHPFVVCNVVPAIATFIHVYDSGMISAQVVEMSFTYYSR